MSLIDLALGFAGVPQQDIDDLNKSLPGFSRIADAARAAEPLLTQAQPHIDAMAPHVVALIPILTKLAPIVEKAWPDIVGVTPTVQELIAFLKSKSPPVG